MKIAYLLFAGAAVIATPALAQDRIVVVQAGQLLDKPGSAAKGPSTIVIRNGRIAEILPGIVDGPAGAERIDLRDKFVLPGLIDSHVHLDSDAGGMLRC
jgi:imidazolonepropionase-like amidohydrolase